MAQLYSGGIVTATGFKIEAPQIIDDRCAVDLDSDLDNIPNKCKGLHAYSDENGGSLWFYNGTDWIKIATGGDLNYINPNDFEGTDTEKLNAASLESFNSGKPLIISHNEDRDSALWLLDSALLVYSNTTTIIDGAILKLKDTTRDNIIRSGNAGLGISNTLANRFENITILGVNGATLSGAENPRATGDSGKTLTLTSTDPHNSQSYGSDAGDSEEKQTSDWRNHGVIMACVDGLVIKGVHIERAHAYGVQLERSTNFLIEDLTFDSPLLDTIAGNPQYIKNRDGINVRINGGNGIINNIKGLTGDDLVALNDYSSLNSNREPGTDTGNHVTGSSTNVEDYVISNVKISNIYHDTPANGVRLYNHNGTVIRGVVIENIFDASELAEASEAVDGAGVIIGAWRSGMSVTPIGTTEDIIINNVISKHNQYGVRVEGTLLNSSITGVIKEPNDNLPQPPISFGFEAYAENTTFSNLFDVDEGITYLTGVYSQTDSLSLIKNSEDELAVLIGNDELKFPTETTGTLAIQGDIPSVISDLSDVSPYTGANQFAITNSFGDGVTWTEIKGSYMGMTSGARVPTWNAVTEEWGSGLTYSGTATSGTSILLRNNGRLVGADAVNDDESVMFGQAKSLFQPLDSDLTAIAALSTNGFAKRTGTGTWAIDTNTYLTANQTITLSGDVTGSGTTAISGTIANDAVTNAKLNNMAQGTIKGRVSSGTGDPQDLTLDAVIKAMGLAIPVIYDLEDFTLPAMSSPPAQDSFSPITILSSVSIPANMIDWEITWTVSGIHYKLSSIGDYNIELRESGGDIQISGQTRSQSAIAVDDTINEPKIIFYIKPE